MGGVVKSGKWGVFFVKIGPFLNAGCIMYSISIFYFTFYFFGGAYAPNARPLPYTGLLLNILHAIMSAVNMSTLIRRIQKLLYSCHRLTFSLSKTV